MTDLKEVYGAELRSIIDTREPIGLFYCRVGRVWVAVDNSTGDAWTEDFPSESSARTWLLGATKSAPERMALATREMREWMNQGKLGNSVFSRTLEALNVGDFLEIKAPKSYRYPEVCEVVLVEGRKMLYATDQKPRKGHKTLVLTLTEHTIEREENGFATNKVDYTWGLKEKEE